MTIARPTLVSQVADAIDELIVDEGLRPGALLPAVSELAARFGVNRLVVREAMRAVEARGLIVARQGKRAMVVALHAAPLMDFFALAVRRDPDTVLELLEVRRAIEVHIASLAATRIEQVDPALLTDMEQSVATMRSAEAGSVEFVEADVHFHEVLAHAADNRLLRFLVEGLGEALRAGREASASGHRARGGDPYEAVQRHRDVLARVRAGDAGGAACEMARHLDDADHDVRAWAPVRKRVGDSAAAAIAR